MQNEIEVNNPYFTIEKKVDADKGLALTPCVFCGKPVPYVKCMEQALCQEHGDCDERIRRLLIEALQKKEVNDGK